MITAESRPEKYLTRFSNGTITSEADTNADHGGMGGGFRPHELLEAALANCMNMTVRMCAEKYAIPLSAVSVSVSLDRSNPEASAFAYRVEFADPLTDAQKSKLLAALERCPVRKTLSSPFRFTLQS